MRSKARQTFETRINYFWDDIELVDVLRTAILDNDLTDPNSTSVLAGVDTNRHLHLKRRRNVDGSRKLVADHLRGTIHSSFVKDVYEEITQYLKTILSDAAKSGYNPERIIGEHAIKLNAKDVLGWGSWEKVCEHVTESVFQALEQERSTTKLLKKMSTKLGLNVPQNLINDAIPYLEIRHFLVHSDAKVPRKFRNSYPNFTYTSQKIRVDFSFVTDIRRRSLELIQEFDESVVQNDLLAEEYLMP